MIIILLLLLLLLFVFCFFVFTFFLLFLFFNFLNYKEDLFVLNRLMENEDLNPILGDLISSAVSSISNLVMIHSMTWEVFRQFLDVVLQVVTKYPSSKSLTLAMNCAYHSLVFVWSERSIGNECDVECESRINLIINCVLECASLVTASGSSTRFCLDEVGKCEYEFTKFM